jgi:two-component system response regulator AtoC
MRVLSTGIRGVVTPAGSAKIAGMPSKVYIVDDDLSFAKLLAVNLTQAGSFRTEVFECAEDLYQRCVEQPPDAVITDLLMPKIGGIEVTQGLRKIDPHLPVFVLTAHADMETAIEALKAGANEYLTKPVNLDELNTLLRRALAERPMREEAATLQQTRKEKFSAGAILGKHAKIKEVREFVERVAAIPYPTVLLLGESGTGKNLVARAIHYSSSRAARRFVEINCTALPSHLLEAELFGYQKGAFTDARESKRGLIEVANGGTLFLDEIGDIPAELQAKLLNFLESRRFRRVGGTDEMEVELSIITATNQDLESRVRRGVFRADLYYRISVVVHLLPALRTIRDDIPILADHFRAVFNQEFGKEVGSISDAARARLIAWDWPGNARELRNVIERAMIFADKPILEEADLPPLGLASGAAVPPSSTDHFAIAKGLSLAEAEREYIRFTLSQCDSVQQASEVLGISRKNLWEKRKKHGLLDEV